MVKIQRKISNNRNHYNGTNKRLKITVHQTGNTSRGANAEMHARFINNGASETWHYTVDDKQAIQHFEHNTQCWHAGDGRGNGNLHSIGVELCINSDGDYNKMVQNGAELVRHLMDTLNLGINDVVQHNHWSGKDCPKQIRAGKNGINWAKFKQMVQGNTNVSKPVKPSTNKPKPAPSKPKPANKANLKVDGYLGPDTVKALQHYFGLIVDGEIWGQYSGNQATKAFNRKAVKYGKGGSPVVKALQKKIGVTADGIWGANTTRALQRYLGTPVDGIISRPSTAIKELQRRLNNGTF